MFTGIVRHVGKVLDSRVTASGRRLTIDLGPLAENLSPGDSVAVSGACLTAVSVSGTAADFDAVAETLSRTTLGSLQPASKVNLERALRLSDALDGHLVQGHVDGQAVIRTIRLAAGQCIIEFTAPPELLHQMVPKGSVAVSGISLTIVDVGPSTFSVSVIPETLERTTLGLTRIGDKVNIETDIVGKYILKYLNGLGTQGGGLTLEKLKQTGFA